jgi:hypothetical protein
VSTQSLFARLLGASDCVRLLSYRGIGHEFSLEWSWVPALLKCTQTSAWPEMPDLPVNLPPDDPLRNRRALPATDQSDNVTFAPKRLSPERLNALRQFLKSARADEIAAIRGLYGDTPEVLIAIGLETFPGND